MKVVVDLNILIDVLQQREPFFSASAKVCDLISNGRCEGVVAAHSVTTLFYIIHRCADWRSADVAFEWMLSTFKVAPADKSVFLAARALGFSDFEDAVVAATAAANLCDFIVTRNLNDFSQSTVPAVAPEEMIELCKDSPSRH